jgi:hypothetical protein
MACAVTASAEPRRERVRERVRDRTRGKIVRPERARIHTNPITGRQRRGVIYERRPISVIRRDPYVIRYDVSYRPRHTWHYYHPTNGWSVTWGLRSWNVVSTVTCEAANEMTGELYPVVADRSTLAWSDQTVNSVLEQALDNCAYDGGPDVCVPVEPACTYQ